MEMRFTLCYNGCEKDFLEGAMKRFKKLFEKRWIFISAVCAILFVLLCVRYYRHNVKDMRILSANTGTIVGAENAKVEQTLKIPPSANTLSLFFSTNGQELKGQTSIRLVHASDGTAVQEWEIANETIEDNQYHPLELKADFSRGNTDNRYAVIVERDPSCEPGSAPILCYWAANPYSDGQLYINGNITDGDLCFALSLNKAPEVLRIYIFVVGILLLLLLASFFLFAKLGNNIEKVFLLCVLMLGIAYMTVLPAESAPDEDRHIISAYHLSNIMLGGPEPEGSLVYFREKDLSGLYGEYPNGHTYVSMYGNFFSDSPGENYVLLEKDFIIQTPFWTYLPQALGISLGRVLNCNGTVTILLGRLFSLFFFAGVTCFAIKILPFGKNILLAVSLLPMTMELAASYSYDSMIIALTFLYIALMCRLIFAKEALVIQDIVLPAIVLAMLSPHKYVYTPLALLSLFLPGEKYKAKKEKWISVGILFGGTALVLLSLMGGERIYVPNLDTTEYRTIGYCLRNPKEVIGVYVYTVLRLTPYYVSSMVGMFLGWLEMNMPQEVLLLSLLNLFMAAVKTDSEDRVLIKNRHYFAFLMCFGAVVFATLTAMLLVWTPSWSRQIEGVQGRYFLPVLPLFLLCVRKMNIRSGKSMLKPIVYVGFWVNAVCLLRCFSIIVGR